MIAALAVDLLAKVRSVGALADSTGLTLVGRKEDPGLLKIPLPAAWVALKSDAIDDGSALHADASMFVRTSQDMLAVFAVTVFMPYIDDADVLTTQFPLLEAITLAVHGTDSPSGLRWRYIGQKNTPIFPDRLVYEQRYTVTTVIGA